jgi:hypothetical protein
MELFAETFLPSGLGEQWFASTRCPACDHRALRPVIAGSAAHWLCPSCGRCYRAEHGRLRTVDPVTCEGCGRRDRRECITTVYGLFPRFGADDDPLLGELG